MHTWAILLALVIIVGSHIHMLMSDKDKSKTTHAYVMLATAGLIAYGAFTR
jgi:hypothetical protein